MSLRLYPYTYSTAGSEEEAEGKAIPYSFVQVTLADWGLKGLGQVSSSIFSYLCQGKVNVLFGSKSIAWSLIATCKVDLLIAACSSVSVFHIM